ncbi:MAG: pseudouridine synthase [Spirulinaceae cyanobacterium]
MSDYILFNKPYGVLCQFTDRNSSKKHPTLKDYISLPSVYPVGRLDLDSEGLLLLTNNGKVQHKVSHRKFQHPRTYWVQVERIPTLEALQKLAQGVKIKNYHTRQAQVKQLSKEPFLPPRHPPIRHRKNVPTGWLEITLTEGRNRQVRRMTAAIGHPTLRLVRVSLTIGLAQKTKQLNLQGLKPGQWRYLTSQEQEILEKL